MLIEMSFFSLRWRPFWAVCLVSVVACSPATTPKSQPPTTATPGGTPAPASGVTPRAPPDTSGTTTDVDPGPGTDTDKAMRRCAAMANDPVATSPATPATVFASTASGWLYTRGNHLYNSDGSLFHGRGANLADTRGCGACACNVITLEQSTQEVMRRIDTLVDDWHANFIRLDLESYAATAKSAVDDPAYLESLKRIVAHVQTKPHVYIVMSVWFDPSLDANGWPTDATNTILQTLVDAFGQVPQVLFGICNEPQKNNDGAWDSQVWTRMNDAAATIRAAEAASSVPAHIILAQGTGGWARLLSYYETHPLAAGQGSNIAYETHVYDAESAFDSRFIEPSKSIPVIIGEFGPIDGVMTLEDTARLMAQAEAADVPYIAWTFHGRCVPSLLVDTSGGGCGIGMLLTPSTWGAQLQAQLAHPW